MLLILCQCNNQANAAAREYAEYYPHRRHPDANVIRRAKIRLRETDSTIIHRQDAGRGRNVRTIVEKEILEMIETEPGIRICAISSQINNVSRSTVHRVLQDKRMHPYHFSLVQHLKEEDAELRIQFCRWLLRQHNTDNRFSTRILFTDKSRFTREKMFNLHNMNY